MIQRFFGAIAFLTILPIRGRTGSTGDAALFFPLTGALLGAAGGLILEGSSRLVPPAMAALLALLFWALITGGLHEDAVADVADAFRSWRPPEKIIAILKDSRTGAHGALALILLVLIRWQALTWITTDLIPALAAALAVSRASMVALIWSTPPAGSGNAMAMSETLTTPVALAVVVQGIAFSLLPGGRPASLILGGATCMLLIARRYFINRIGGVTGDCAGALGHVIETWCLVICTCRPCI